MIFKPEITLGVIIQIVIFVVALAGGIRKFGILEQKLNIMYNWFEKVVLNHELERRNKEFYGGKE